MENENRINQSWKNKLEDEAALQDEALQDKAAAWQQLQLRLHQHPGRKRAVWYWAAAACLLLMTTLPFAIQQNKKNGLVKKTTPEEIAPVLPKSSFSPKSEKTLAKSVAAVPSVKKETRRRVTINSSVATVVNNDSALIINSGHENTNITSIPLPVSDNTTTTIAIVKSKKQLKLVHVNELGDPLMESHIPTSTTEPHVFVMQIGKEEIITNNNINVNKSRFAAITIKTSPTN